MIPSVANSVKALCPHSWRNPKTCSHEREKSEGPYRSIVEAVVRGPSSEYRSPDHGDACRCLCEFLPI